MRDRTSTQCNITQARARRKVNVFVLSEIGTGLGGDTPVLVVDKDRQCWRVPIILALPTLGRLGQVGEIDVDAQTGEILADAALVQSITQHAERLFAGAVGVADHE